MKHVLAILTVFLTFQFTSKAENPAAKIQFTSTEHDFGNQPQGKPVTWEFEFTNQGKEALVLDNVSASCGCTTPTWTKEPVLPQKKGTVSAQYNMAREGTFTKSITVTTKDGETVTLVISGNAITQEQGVNKSENNMLGGNEE